MCQKALYSKQHSLKHLVEIIAPSAILVQESKLKKIGQINFNGYKTFERLRKNKDGGGLLTAVVEDLSPVLVSVGSETNEILTVQVNVGGRRIRIINAYAPQETPESFVDKSLEFWEELEKEIVAAFKENCMILIELDANAKIGSNLIKNNPHQNVTNNGKFLIDMAERRNLVILNTLKKCEGTITRQRKVENKIEKSVLDYFLVSEDLCQFLEKMHIDEEQALTLTRYDKKDGNIKSDHNVLHCKFTINYTIGENKKSDRTVFNLRNTIAKNAFVEDLCKNNTFAENFDEHRDFSVNVKMFMHSKRNYSKVSRRQK